MIALEKKLQQEVIRNCELAEKRVWMQNDKISTNYREIWNR